MKNFLVKCTLAVAAISPFSSQAEVINLSTNGDWEFFTFVSNGSDFKFLDSFEFVLTAPAVLRVTDLAYSGDRFELFSNGVSLGLTSDPVAGKFVDTASATPEDFFADPDFSHGSWTLNAGTYTITGDVVKNFTSAGSAAISLKSMSLVPEPSALASTAIGLVAIAGLCLRRRKASSLTLS